jgi:hypothetical protein
MLLSAVITNIELSTLLDSLTPLRIVIDERRGRVVEIGRPMMDLVAGRGLRLRGDARVVWDVAGVPIPVTIQAWQVLLVPAVVPRTRTRVLTFDPIIELLDLKHMPGFLDDKIAGAIRDAIVQNREKIAWDFVRTLSKRLTFPRVSPAKTFEIGPIDGKATVTATELRLDLVFEAKIEPKRTTTPVRESAKDAGDAAPASVR